MASLRRKSEARIELTCLMLPDEPEDVEVERYDETKSMWARAKRIAKKYEATTNFGEHYDFGEACVYGDAYVYPSLDVLEAILDEFDAASVAYDNIDLPDIHGAMLEAMLERYPRGSGVKVNLGVAF